MSQGDAEFPKWNSGADWMRRVNCEVAVRLPIPSGSFKAYLFDCDGTVADSMPSLPGMEASAGEWGCTFAGERFYELGGVPSSR